MGAMYNAEDFRSATPYQPASDEQMEDGSVNNLFKDIKRETEDNISGHIELIIINVRDKNGYILLQWAVCNSHKHVVYNLLDAGANPKRISSKGNTQLHIVASSKGNKEIAVILKADRDWQ
ncbi:hypothetical protein AVEN_164568-1 [Araneus ventricosus]|uniref:Uncharacterized protein n=1 Tax=Araneus ventricosus TaxID=182803 RepID=A0A4Y2B244_ARAVE|nr:hypothetical protein AVEN_164568-1 [Araneus ventricosus]